MPVRSVTNIGPTPISLDDVSLQYWFAAPLDNQVTGLLSCMPQAMCVLCSIIPNQCLACSSRGRGVAHHQEQEQHQVDWGAPGQHYQAVGHLNSRCKLTKP
jgi:hypothetical protein